MPSAYRRYTDRTIERVPADEVVMGPNSAKLVAAILGEPAASRAELRGAHRHSPRWRALTCISGAICVGAMMASPGMAGSLAQCEVGQWVEEDGGRQGQIIGERDTLCLVRSDDGRLQSWIPAQQLSPVKPTDAPADAAEPIERSNPTALPADNAKPAPDAAESAAPAGSEEKSRDEPAGTVELQATRD